jgi:hypothetical protein
MDAGLQVEASALSALSAVLPFPPFRPNTYLCIT